MKQKLLKVSSLFAVASILLSCDSDDGHDVQTVGVLQAGGAFVVNSGNSEEAIGSSVTFYDYASSAATDFSALTQGASDAIVYGTKLYVVVPSALQILVYDAATGRQIESVSTTSFAGNDRTLTPRRITAAGGNIYLSTKEGLVTAVDTIQYRLVNTYQAGSCPEGIAVVDGILYVANSDGGKQQAPSISVINLGTGASRTITHTFIRFPQDVVVVGSSVYYLDLGSIDEVQNIQTGNGVYCYQGDSITKVVDATAMAVGTSKFENENSICIYTYNMPIGSNYAEYWAYYIATRQAQYFTFDGVDNPCAIGVDPLSNQVFIASNQVRKVGKWNTEPDYTIPGYVSVYGTDGIRTGSFDCGVCPSRFAFKIGVKYVDI